MPNIICITCDQIFYVPQCRITQAIKNNCAVKYCSSKCYNKNGIQNPMYGKNLPEEVRQNNINRLKSFRFASNQENPNKRYDPSIFVGSTYQWWKKRLLSTIGKCEICGYSEHPEILEIHHKDRNRENNARSNLILAYPNCHALDHYNNKDGKYSHVK